VSEAAPAEEVIFKNTVEALFLRALAGKLSLRCVERMRDAGIDLRGKLKGFYPRVTFYRCVRIAGEELFPELGEDARMVQLGVTFMEGFEQTLIGKAALAAARFMGPLRTLGRMAANYRTSNNYMRVELKEEKPGEACLTLSQTSGAPGYFEGALRRGLTFAGVRGLMVRREASDGVRCTFRISWTP
jgi:uncharacterized protein (TIGR02265 family)